MFPERLRELRKSRNITLEMLAEALNQQLDPGQKPNTAAQIGNWERGDRSPSYLEVRKLADFFEVTMDFLVGRASDETTDLSLLFLSGKEIDFNGKALTDQERFDIFQIINRHFAEKNSIFGNNNQTIINQQGDLF
ncbi:helix-turn-helix transcriptional regulator [Weissella koreensis]|uniref:Helix-turn-helix transcriptional regulator n=1 Tax=Weissella koreensis TaxID=165096 RepID=A0A7H1MLG9_9LACO|nr:helix-turn-helix transcriptional regulator [Weissella koreensis]AEJ23466.1 XRE family transcriptional regulator [Weissella koreensis KACC 15510]AVH75101.1 XRE family transcriptional regulator [Weissella koreensis]EJF33511.1 XRE family transcriptional regulator [Weissella koreensis KCTC 3621]MCZ9310961.1 helix-turn-helix transcriptional regulator [Weissella koreensis]QGN20327.1 helix-turn-helix domain-containing protein [Weissella koreensis]